MRQRLQPFPSEEIVTEKSQNACLEQVHPSCVASGIYCPIEYCLCQFVGKTRIGVVLTLDLFHRSTVLLERFDDVWRAALGVAVFALLKLKSFDFLGVSSHYACS